MTRLIVMGNSHVAALKVAWDRMAAAHPDLEVDFFAAMGSNFRRFRLLDGLRFGLPDGHKLPPERFDVSGRDAIDLGWADHVIWAGCYWPHDALADLMRDFDIDGLREVGAPRALSRPAFDAILRSLAEALAPGPEWRDWTPPRPRLLQLPAPMRSRACLRSGADQFKAMKTLGRDGTGGREVVRAFMDAWAQTLRAMGIGFIAQPPETLLASGLSDPRYSRDARKLSATGGRNDDFTHLNGDYGELHLTEVLVSLGLAERPAPGWRTAARSALKSAAGRKGPASLMRELR